MTAAKKPTKKPETRNASVAIGTSKREMVYVVNKRSAAFLEAKRMLANNARRDLTRLTEEQIKLALLGKLNDENLSEEG